MHRKHRKDASRALCAEWLEGDGERIERERPGARQDSWRQVRLCAQIRRAINDALGAQCGHPLLRELYVSDVVPAPDITHLRVLVPMPAALAPVGVAAVEAALNGAKGFLRTHVAQVIRRSRTPELTFAVVPAQEDADA